MLKTEGGIEIIGEARNGQEAIDSISAQEPDLVFLDVQMPDHDGFEVLQNLKVKRMPVIIFVTAYDQHAMRAFDVHAIDYLTKPFDRKRFADALDRAPPAAPCAVLVDRVDRVLAARRHVAALPAEQSPERDAVEEDEMDQQPVRRCCCGRRTRRRGAPTRGCRAAAHPSS